MKQSLTESTVLFLSIIKWVFLATMAGLIVGSGVTIFLKIFVWSLSLRLYHPHFFWFLPLSLFISAIMIKYLAPEAEGHGTEKVIEAIHKRAGKIPNYCFGSSGKTCSNYNHTCNRWFSWEKGPCAQIGAGLTSLFSDLFKFDDYDRKKMVICGISAGFASVFGTPIAGSIFGVKVLFVGTIMYDVLLPSFIAGIIAYHVSSFYGITYFHKSVTMLPVFSEAFLLKVLLAGLFFGICSIFLIEVLKWCDRISKRLHFWQPLKGALGGILLIILTYLFSNNYLGLGLETIESTLKGSEGNWYMFLIKPFFTGITLSFGGSGGIVTPIFFIGSTAGAT